MYSEDETNKGGKSAPRFCPRQGGNGQLYILSQGRKLRLVPISPTYFVPEDDSGIHVEFVPYSGGTKYEAIAYLRYGEKERISRVKVKE